MLANETKNQHFISQAEQRLNAIPGRPGSIYALRVIDRESYSVRSTRREGVSIRRSLAGADLFTFDQLDDQLRQNYESLFQRYEHDVRACSEALLAKLISGSYDIKHELLSVYTAKLLNFARNPFCIRKVLNTFRISASLEFTDQANQRQYERVLSGLRAHESRICRRYSITPGEYTLWLRTLFAILCVPPGEHNLLEGAIKSLFESSTTAVLVSHYTDSDPTHVCLLSDRGFNSLEDETEAGVSSTIFEFNISSRAFVRFGFSNPREFAKDRNLRPEFISAASGQITVQLAENDLAQLSAYNRLTIFQSAEHVYSASSRPLI